MARGQARISGFRNSFAPNVFTETQVFGRETENKRNLADCATQNLLACERVG